MKLSFNYYHRSCRARNSEFLLTFLFLLPGTRADRDETKTWTVFSQIGLCSFYLFDCLVEPYPIEIFFTFQKAFGAKQKAIREREWCCLASANRRSERRREDRRWCCWWWLRLGIFFCLTNDTMNNFLQRSIDKSHSIWESCRSSHDR